MCHVCDSFSPKLGQALASLKCGTEGLLLTPLIPKSFLIDMTTKISMEVGRTSLPNSKTKGRVGGEDSLISQQ